MVLPDDYRQWIETQGFAIVDDVLDTSQVEHYREAISSIEIGQEVRRKAEVYGIRNLLGVCSEVRSLATTPQVRELVEPILGTECFAVRATFFDKVSTANWNVGLHQDCFITVQHRIDTNGFGPWSQKACVIQVRPPEDVLKGMLAVRIHLDDCRRNNGALRILAGSHIRHWSQEEVSRCRTRFPEQICEVSLGGVLAMRPLALHASSASEAPDHRRVIHIEFANQELPNGLEWKNRISPNLETNGSSQQ